MTLPWEPGPAAATDPRSAARSRDSCSAPAELGRHVAKDRLDHVRVVVDAQLVGHGQEEGVRGGNGRVVLQLPDQLRGLRRI